MLKDPEIPQEFNALMSLSIPLSVSLFSW